MTFSAEEFRKEFTEFRRLIGTRPFWELPDDTRERALQGFTLVYINATPDERWNQALIDRAYQANITEYLRRERYNGCAKVVR